MPGQPESCKLENNSWTIHPLSTSNSKSKVTVIFSYLRSSFISLDPPPPGYSNRNWGLQSAAATVVSRSALQGMSIGRATTTLSVLCPHQRYSGHPLWVSSRTPGCTHALQFPFSARVLPPFSPGPVTTTKHIWNFPITIWCAISSNNHSAINL